MRTGVGVAVLAALLAAACGGGVALPDTAGPAAAAVAPTPTTTAVQAVGLREVDALQETLDAVATGFLAADPEAVRPWLLDPESAFGERWLARAGNMAGLPLASYALAVDASLPDLATADVRARHDGDVQVVYVVEELALDGYDVAPAAEDLFLTLVTDADGVWRVASDVDAEPLGLVSVDHLWDHGPVVVTGSGPVVAIHHPDGPAVGPLLEEAAAALAEAAERWPLDWPQRVPIVVPRDQDELGELLHVTFDLSNFVAFATSTVAGELGEYLLTGSRIVLNSERFLNRSTQTRQLILVHELLHVATRPVAGPMVPSWLEEGIAQAVGEQRSTTGTRLLNAVASSALDLPTDGEFTVGGSDRVFLSYQLSWGFVDHLLRTYGTSVVADFYAAAGQGAVGRPGSEAAQVDRAAREAFGVGIDELVAEWRANR